MSAAAHRRRRPARGAMFGPRRGLMRSAIAAAAIALGLAGALAGCGLKGSLYLPSQKKAKVPATATNPAPDAPNSPNSTSSTNPPEAAPAAGAQAPPP